MCALHEVNLIIYIQTLLVAACFVCCRERIGFHVGVYNNLRNLQVIFHKLLSLHSSPHSVLQANEFKSKNCTLSLWR